MLCVNDGDGAGEGDEGAGDGAGESDEGAGDGAGEGAGVAQEPPLEL